MTVLSLHSWLDPGWLPENFGYYMHAGRVYITGRLVNNIEWQEEEAESKAPPSRVICRGLPGALRPKEPIRVMLPVEPFGTEYPVNPVLNPQREYSSTVYPDGLWLLDTLPDRFIHPPEGWRCWIKKVIGGEAKLIEVSQYSLPLELTLITGNASWPVGATADSYALEAIALLEPGKDFTGEPKAAKHQQREHLGGLLTCVHDEEGAEHIAVSPEADAAINLIDKSSPTDYTWVVGPGGWRVPLLIGESIRLAGLDLMRPASDSPPLVKVTGQARTEEGDRGEGGPNYAPAFLNRRRGQQLYTHWKRTEDTFECTEKGFFKTTTVICHGLTNAPSVKVHPLELLAEAFPPPQWFMMYLEVDVPELLREVGNSGCRPEELGCERWEVYYGEHAVLPVIPYEWIEPPGVHPEVPPHIGAAMIPKPPVSYYKGDPHTATVQPFGYEGGKPTKDAAPYIWRRDQCPASFTVEWPGLLVYRAMAEALLRVVPLWEDRQWGLRAGDTLDLSLTGYPRRYVSTGHVDTGPVTQAAIPREED